MWLGGNALKILGHVIPVILQLCWCSACIHDPRIAFSPFR